MLVKMELIALNGSGIVYKTFNTIAMLSAPTDDEPARKVEASKITLKDMLIVDGITYHIACLYLAE